MGWNVSLFFLYTSVKDGRRLLSCLSVSVTDARKGKNVFVVACVCMCARKHSSVCACAFVCESKIQGGEGDGTVNLQ